MRQRYIPELLEIHRDELAFLWGQRRAALHSSRHSLREFTELNERIEAHVQGLLVAPPDALLALLGAQLAAPERDEAFAAGFALLRLGQPTVTERVVQAFAAADGPALAGLCDALGAAPWDLFAGAMQAALDGAAPLTAACAAVVLANHRALTGHAARLRELLGHGDATVCALAWRAAAVTDARDATPAHARPYQHALAHPAPAVRHAAWGAAAWTGQAQALPLLRHFTEQGDPVALHWLAVLGGGDDVALIQRAALAQPDVQARCELLARFGHPSALNALVRWMDDGDPALAAAAGAAFARITGIEVHGQRRALPPGPGADEFDREMAPLVWLPDAAKARDALARHGPAWADGARWCRGLRLDLEDPALLPQLDLQARWDTGARAALAGRALFAPPPVW